MKRTVFLSLFFLTLSSCAMPPKRIAQTPSGRPEVNLNTADIDLVKGTIINEMQGAKSEDKFSLTEAERYKIYKEMVAAEDKAWAYAEEKYSVFGRSTWGLSKSEIRSRMHRGTDLAIKLGDQYENELAKKYGLTREQLEQIIFEGLDERWYLE